MAKTRKTAAKKHVGDVIGLGRARARQPIARAKSGRKPKGIELPRAGRRTSPKQARTVGGVRGRGR